MSRFLLNWAKHIAEVCSMLNVVTVVVGCGLANSQVCGLFPGFQEDSRGLRIHWMTECAHSYNWILRLPDHPGDQYLPRTCGAKPGWGRSILEDWFVAILVRGRRKYMSSYHLFMGRFLWTGGIGAAVICSLLFDVTVAIHQHSHIRCKPITLRWYAASTISMK